MKNTKSALLTTVYHTASNHFYRKLLKKYEQVAFTHINTAALSKADVYDDVYTTYRDPYRVAASWYNRGRFDTAQGRASWMTQWHNYSKLLEKNPTILRTEGTRGKANLYWDKRGAHALLDERDMLHFNRLVPKSLINHALECCKLLR